MAARKRGVTKVTAEFQRDEDSDELLVFGYQCKIFRDDEKAMFIDKGHHLIPWMNDESLKIDRFDGRGHLFNLKPYDADILGGHNSALSLEEQRVEELCDEERYLELHCDVMEKAMYEEEELKRLNEALQNNPYSAIDFDYNAPPPQQVAVQPVAKTESDEEEEFVVPAEMKLPYGVKAPSTKKVHAIIEKTAVFLSKHGPQMEIVIKTKQNHNPQFKFLDFENELNLYYKHMVKMIKAGKYHPAPPPEKVKQDETTDDESDEESDMNGSGYLHPSLTTNAKSDYQDDILSVIQHKLPKGDISNTPYAKLINNLSKHSGRDSPNVVNQIYTTNSHYAPVSTVPCVSYSHTAAPSGLAMMHTTNVHTDTHTVIPQQEVTTQENTYPVPPPPGMEPVTLPQSDQPPPPGTESPTALTRRERRKRKKNKSGPDIVPPPPDLQPIIDKMAEYVAKNGADFENTVRGKTDQRFEFLLSHHVHYQYYEHKKNMFIKEFGMEDEFNKCSAPKAVSFSIRSKESESGGLEKRSAFRHESSDEGSDGEGSDSKDSASDQPGESSDNQTSSTEQRSYDDRPERVSLSAEELERRQAEERLKDRLAAAARDKLAQTSKEKQLQAERKRKAAMFLTMLKGTSTEQSNADDATDSQPQEAANSTPASSPHHSVSNSPHDHHSRTKSSSRSLLDRSPSHRSAARKSPSYRRSASPRSSSRKSSHSSLKSSHDRSRRSRSRSPRHHRLRRSRSRSPRRRRSKTPPSAYTIIRRSRSRSAERRRVRSRSRSPTSRSRRSTSRSRRSGSKSKKPKKRSKSRSRSRSKTKSQKKSRSKSPHHKKSKKSRSKSRSPSRRSASRKTLAAGLVSATLRASGGSAPANMFSLGAITEEDRPIVVDASPDKFDDNEDTATQVEISTNSNDSSAAHTHSTIAKEVQSTIPENPVNNDLMKKVRAMLKGLRQEVRKDDL